MPPLGRHGAVRLEPLPEPAGPFLPQGPPTVKQFRAMLGMCAHAQWVNEPGTVYDPLATWQRVVDLAVSCGISWHRTEQSIGQAYMRDGLAAKHAYSISKGLKLTFIINGYWDGAEAWYGTPEAQVQYILDHYPLSSILAFEHVNEPDNFHSEPDSNGVGQWPGMLADHMVRVQRAIRSHPELDSVPILGPALCFNTAYPLGQALRARGVDPRQVMDVANPHPYDGGDMPKLQHYADERTKYGDLGRTDLWLTEWGYFTSLATHDYAPVDEKTQAIYTLKGWATQWLFGVRYSSFYAFMDTQTNTTVSETNFGWFRSDFTTKPAGAAMQNLMAYLGPKGDPAAPAPRAYSLTGPADLRHFQVQRADGSHVIFLWRETLVWNRDTKVPITVAPQTVSISSPGAAFAANNPRTGQSVPMLGGGINVDGDLYLVELR